MTRCPVEEMMKDIGRTWMIPLLRLIDQEGDQGFNYLQETLGLSSKVLADRLTLLENHFLIDRRYSTQDGQRRSHYALTEKGKEILPIVLAWQSYCQKYTQLCGNCRHGPSENRPQHVESHSEQNQSSD